MSEPDRTNEPDIRKNESPREPLTGQDDHDQNRANEGEGGRAGWVEDGNELPEYAIFDGKGNESVVVVGADEKGNKKEGTGPDREAAKKNMKDSKDPLGPDFSPGP